MTQTKKTTTAKAANSSSNAAPADWQWFLQALDQKLDNLRLKTEGMVERFHQFDQHQTSIENSLQASLHAHKLDLQQLEQSLQYLSHKTQLQLKEMENANDRFMHQTEKRVSDIHFATREELSAIARRLEILEKLLL